MSTGDYVHMSFPGSIFVLINNFYGDYPFDNHIGDMNYHLRNGEIFNFSFFFSGKFVKCEDESLL